MGGTAPRLRCLHQSLDFITQIKSLFKFTDVVSRSKNWPAGKMTFCVTCNAGGKGQSKHRQSNQTKQK